jgi:hypothetical protein
MATFRLRQTGSPNANDRHALARFHHRDLRVERVDCNGRDTACPRLRQVPVNQVLNEAGRRDVPPISDPAAM